MYWRHSCRSRLRDLRPKAMYGQRPSQHPPLTAPERIRFFSKPVLPGVVWPRCRRVLDPRRFTSRSVVVLFAGNVAFALLPESVPAQGGAGGVVQSHAGSRLTLVDAVRRGLEQYPSVRAARAATDQANAGIHGAAAARLPSLALSASATQYEEPMLVTPIHGLSTREAPPFDETLVQGAATMSYTLFDGGARGARIRRARESAAAAEATRAGTEHAIVARVTAAYVEIQARRQIVDAHDHRLGALSAELSRARQRFDAGRAPQVEVLRAEAALASAQAERVRFGEALDLVERELARLTGAREEETRAARLAPIRLADSLLLPRPSLLEAARDASPSLTRARAMAAAADADVSLARSARWPEIKLTAGYYQRGSADTRSWGEWAAGTSLSLPLFTGGAINADVARSRAGRREAEEALRLGELQVAQELDGALSAVAEAHARQASLTAAATRFAEVARIQKLALDAGSGTQTDYLIAEADLLASRASLAEATMSEIIARAELARVTGQLNIAWVQRVIESSP